MKKIYNFSGMFRQFGIAMLTVIFFLSSCKEKEIIGKDPYEGGIGSFGVKFLDENPEPGIANPGTAVRIQITGLEAHKEKMKFYVNQTLAQVQEVTDSSVVILIPETASTGGTSVEIDGQIFFGPRIKVSGKVEAEYFSGAGVSGSIFDYNVLTGGNYLMTGFIKKYNDKDVKGLFVMKPNGNYDNSLTFGQGVNGAIYSIHRLNNGEFMIAGSFNNFNKKYGINNVTRLNADGTLDSMIVTLKNPQPENLTKNADTVARFNGGVIGSVVNSFISANDSTITLLGQFDKYVRYYYEGSNKDKKIVDETTMRQLVRLKIEDGSMDSTFNFDTNTLTSGAGGNGFINDAIMQPDGKIIIVGNFSMFHDKPVNGIARINTDGSLDETFNVGGSGADNSIQSITYNATSGKYMIAGTFTTYNGKDTRGVAMIDADGENDENFEFGELKGGVPTYAAQLNNGKIIVSGNFEKYRGVVRQGFMILNSDGTLDPSFNNTGAFQGYITTIHEESVAGGTSVLLMGSISRFDNENVGNIVRIKIAD